MRRGQATRDERQRVLIVTEGAKTEIVYLDGIRRHYRRPKALWRIEPGGGHPQAIVDRTKDLKLEAERTGDQFDQVWWVFDVESPTPHPGIEGIAAKADGLGYRCAISHPCFELWLLLHFRRQTAALTSEDAERLAKTCGCGYADKDFDFAKVWPHHQQAIDNAEDFTVVKSMHIHGSAIATHGRPFMSWWSSSGSQEGSRARDRVYPCG